MKKEMILTAKVAESSALKTWLKKEAKLHSFCLGQSITNAMALKVIHAEVAGMFTLFAPSAGTLPVLICCAWFVISLYLCKKGGIK